jgi:hypothetical protein
MEPVYTDKQRGEQPRKISGTVKLVFALLLAIVAGIIGYMQIFRSHPSQSTIKKVFDLVEKGDVEGVMEYVDPQGRLGTIWNDNVEGARDKLTSLMEKYRLEFSSLQFDTRAQGDAAEVELKGGRVTVYNRGQDGMPVAFFDLGGSDLVFYLEKKGNRWLIEGINYDISQILSGDQVISPF